MEKKSKEIEEQPKKRRKKRKRFGYYLYAIIILILTVTNVLLSLFLLTYVQRVRVEGTEYSSQKEIVDWVREDPLTMNSLYTVCKFKMGNYKTPTFLESFKVRLGAPWEIKVEVKEKPIAGCIMSNTGYVYFADDGTVLVKNSEKRDGIPVVEGVKIKDAPLHGKLKTSDEKVVTYVLNITKEIEKNKLNPERIVWEKDGMNLYFGSICVKLGKINYDEKTIQIAPILKELEGKKGTLHLEHYSEMSSSISFKEEK